MSAGDAIAADWQVELRGLVMGEDTPYVLAGFEPWAAPVLRSGEMAIAGRDGVVAGNERLGGRLLAADALLASSDPAADLDALRALTAAWGPSQQDVALVWSEFGGQKFLVWGRPRLADPRLAPGLPVGLRFFATDPVVYDATENSETVAFPTATGGLTFPATFPLTFGSGGSSLIDAENAGTADVGWVAEFAGPWVDPYVERVATGETVRLVGSVESGQTLTVDSRGRSIMLAGSARLGWLRPGSQWWDLPAASSTEVRLGGASGSGSATLRWRSGWM